MFVRSMCLFLLFHSVAIAQKADRRRVSSSSFRKQEVIKNLLEAARWRIGNLYLSPLIGLRQFGFDDNVFSHETDQIQSFSIAPQVGARSFYRTSNRWILENSAAYDYLYYGDSTLKNLRGGEYFAESRLYGLFRHAYLDIGSRYNRDRQRLNSELDERATSERLIHTLNFNFQPGPRSQVDFSSRLGSLEFDKSELTVEARERFEVLERDYTEHQMRYSHNWKNVYWPFIEISFHDFDFMNEGNERDGTTFLSTFLGLRTQNAKRLVLEAQLGWVAMDFRPVPALNAENVLVDMDDNVFAYEAFIRYKITRKYYMQGSLLRTPLFSQTVGYTNFISTKQAVELGFETRKKIRIGPELLFGSNSYTKSFDLDPDHELREDTFRGLNLNISFPFRRLFEWRLSAGYQERDSNILGGSNEGYQINSTVRYKRQ